MAPLVVADLFLYHYRESLFAVDVPVRAARSIVLVALGWRLARGAVSAANPALYGRLERGTAGTVGFLIRLALLAVALLVALRTAGFDPHTLAVGGAFTAVVFGIAAQNTLGNVLAGLLLLSARPFRVGDRVRFQAGALAGQLEGVVQSLGLLHVRLARGKDTTVVPNSVAMGAAVAPLREPASVDLRARVKPDVRPSELQGHLEHSVVAATRSRPHISVEEVDEEEVACRSPLLRRPRVRDRVWPTRSSAVGEVTGRA